MGGERCRRPETVCADFPTASAKGFPGLSKPLVFFATWRGRGIVAGDAFVDFFAEFFTFPCFFAKH